MAWFSQNWVWILFFFAFIGMHMFGHGGHGGHGHSGCFELRRHLDAKPLEQRDAFLVRHQCAAGGPAVEVGAPVGGAAQKLLCCGGFGVGGIHFAAQGSKFCQRDVAGAAFCRSGGVGACIERRKGFGALGRQGCRQDVGGGVQVVLGVAADQFFVFGESHVAFHYARAHACCGLVRFLGVLWKHQRSTPMANREVGFFEWPVTAALQFGFERAVKHLAHQKVRAGAQLDIADGLVVLAIGRGWLQATGL